MAEYYPLLARAVASLRDAPAEKRRAIYERARGALLGQLRSMQPAVPEEAITRESVALDEAITRLEAEMPGHQPPTPPTPDPPPIPPPAEPTPAIADAGSPAPAAIPPAPEAASPVVPSASDGPMPPADPIPVPQAPPPPVMTPRVERVVEAPRPSAPLIEPAPPRATIEDAPLVSSAPPLVIDRPEPPVQAPPRSRAPGTARPLAAPPRATGSRPATEALTRIIAADQGLPAPSARLRPEDEALGRPSGALPSAPKLEVQSFADAVVAAAAGAAHARTGDSSPDPVAEAVLPRDEVARPAAPRPITREAFNPRGIILALIGILVVSGIAYTAWRLRDRPEVLARSRAALLAAEQAASSPSGKISNRADGSAPTAPIPVPVPASSPPADPTPATAVPADASVPAVAQQATPGPTTAPATPSDTSGNAPAAGDAAIPVSQRAAFLVDAPDEPSKIKTYVGTVVWRTESVNPGQDQPLAQAVRAEIEIPEVSLKLSMLFQKNFEPQFPASHTLDLRFAIASANPLGGVKQINVPQMRKDDAPSGDSLVGLPVTITENYFLVGLSRGDAMARNLDLIKTRNWFDIPLLMNSGKLAKITFEKGATGARIVDAVIQSWQ